MTQGRFLWGRVELLMLAVELCEACVGNLGKQHLADAHGAPGIVLSLRGRIVSLILSRLLMGMLSLFCRCGNSYIKFK